MIRQENDSPALMGVTIGLAALCASWFQEVGLQDHTVSSTIQDDYKALVQALSLAFDKVVAPGVISTEPEVRQALEAFHQEPIDALLLVHILWSEDQPLMALLEGLPETPVLLWNYYPTKALPDYLSIPDMFRRSGTVGLLQSSAVLQRRGVAFDLVTGTPEDEELRRELEEYATALTIRRRLSGMRAGRIAGRCEVMTGTFVDEQALRARLGVQLVDITAEEYAACCQQVPEADVEDLCTSLQAQFPLLEVSAASLRLACRATLALDILVQQYDLGVLAIQDLDPTLHHLVETRPCLCPPYCAKHGIPIVMESDLTTGLGLLAATMAAAAPGMYTEIFTFDATTNLLLMGHAGVHNPALAAPGPVRIIPDAEYRYVDAVEGAWFEFILAAGPVTCVSLYDAGDRYRMITFYGASQGEPLRLEGYAHAVVQTEVPVTQLLPRLVRRGLTQHFAVVPGWVAGVLEKWARLAGVEFVLEE